MLLCARIGSFIWAAWPRETSPDADGVLRCLQLKTCKQAMHVDTVHWQGLSLCHLHDELVAQQPASSMHRNG